ncbi:jerky protein homolog-like isoform X1 [Formica exsecta]|uniref:jerky protein homolog-like isoform X1 n=1 Tax=Formica exsecta TaxID=72781 RepID=UPI001143C64C|nr:jerky protein homolog-like isoform X1 [Formica exsecta]
MQAEKEYGNLNYSLDEKLYKWWLEQNQLGCTTFDADLKAKMVELVNKFGESSRTNIEHWLRNFKEQHEILQNMPESSQNFVQRNKRELNKAEAKEFVQDFTRRLEQENIIRDNIYALIDMTITCKHPSATKRENLKNDSLTFMLCTNATGNHKLPPFCIYKYTHQKTPKILKNTSPLVYKLQENDFQNQEIIIDWYCNYFIRSVKEHQWKTNISGKVFLLLKNIHKFYALKDIVKVNNFEIRLYPVNSFGKLQPIDPNIRDEIRKFSYKGLKKFYKSLDIEDCIKISCEPWINLMPMDIEKFWKNLLEPDFHTKEDNVTEENTAVEFISKPLDLSIKEQDKNLLKPDFHTKEDNVTEEDTAVEFISKLLDLSIKEQDKNLLEPDFYTKEDNVTEEDTAVELISKPLDFSIKYKRLKQQENTVSTETVCIENAECIEENIEKKDNLATDSHKLQKLIIKNDDIHSDKISEVLASYAKAEAEGHQEQEGDIESIAENTCKRKFSGDLYDDV